MWNIKLPALLLPLLAALGPAAAATTVALQSSANPAFLVSPVNLTAQVSPSTATGVVTYYDGVVPIGVATLSAGAAVLPAVPLGAGVHSLTAYYRGDGSDAPAISAALKQTILALGESGFQTEVNFSGVNNPGGLAVGDFNGDGKADLVVGNVGSDTISVMLGNGDGTFRAPANFMADPATFSSPTGVVVGDFNGDGHMDVATANAASAVSTVAVFLGNGDGTFRPETSYPVAGTPHSLAMADFNGDGIADLVTDNFLNSSISVLLGKSDGTFQPAVAIAVGIGPVATATGDFNGDGRADIAVVTGSSVAVLLGKGDGTFQTPVNYAAGKGPTFVSVGDVNGDGLADLVVSNGSDNNVSVLMGKGDGTFAAAANYPAGFGPKNTVIGDFNSDGVPDLAVANSGGSNISVLLGNGDGTFQLPVNYGTGNDPVPLVAADFNGDGRTDLAVGNYLSGNIGVLLGVAVNEPIISEVVNGASFLNTGLAPGLIFTIAGAALGPAVGQTLQLDSHNHIASSLSGVEVLVDGTPAPLLFVRQDQINAVAPYELDNRLGQNVKVQVQYNGVTGNAPSVAVEAVSPAIFSLGNGQGAIRNQDQSINGPTNPAAPGSIVSIYATGEGQLTPPGVDGQLVTDSNTHAAAAVSVTIGGLAVVPLFAGSTEFDGFFQVNVQAPAGIAGVVPVVLTVGGVASPAGITMAVQ